MPRLLHCAVVLSLVTGLGSASADEPSHSDARSALARAVKFMRDHVSANGAYLWNYSGDLTQREGEVRATASQGWTQPPGTPTVGEAFLEAWLICHDEVLLEAARDAGHALAECQLHSGGWDYVVEFDPEERRRWAFRSDTESPDPKAKNVTTLDDDTTQSVLRFLMKLDRVLDFQDQAIHQAVEYSLRALLKAQYPNGAWPQRYSEFPNAADFPVLKGSYPDMWSRSYPKLDYRSYYTFNDDTLADLIDTMFLASEIYSDQQYENAARRAGDFILLAQMPEPQPAWAQQYNAQMQPAWARRFEPASITGGESQGVIRILLKLYSRTGDERFLEPVPRALDYLKRSELPSGQLPRFLELHTNRPLYFTTQYLLTYDDSDLPAHYGFKVTSKINQLRDQYATVKKSGKSTSLLWKISRTPPAPSTKLARQAAELIAALDERGAWLEKGALKAKGNNTSSSLVLTTRTFNRNIILLSSFVEASRK
jgi:PelA/Pel-15E family pectate lyase